MTDSKTEARFIYASYRKRESAEAALDEMYATGDVCGAERPLIEFILGKYRITLPIV